MRFFKRKTLLSEWELESYTILKKPLIFGTTSFAWHKNCKKGRTAAYIGRRKKGIFAVDVISGF